MSLEQDREQINKSNQGMGMKNDAILTEIEEGEMSEEQMDRVMKKLKEELADVEIPESMEPEQMMDSIEKRLTHEKKIRKIRSIKIGFGTVAACFVLGMGLYSYHQSYNAGANKATNQEDMQGNGRNLQKNGVESTEKETKKSEKETETMQMAQSTQESETSIKETTAPVEVPSATKETMATTQKEQENKNQTVTVEDTRLGMDDVHLATNYEEIYEIVGQAYRDAYSQGYFEMCEEGQKNGETLDGAVAENEASTSSDSSTTASLDSFAVESSDYSKTNTVEEQVDEGDIVKTDGKYIYTLYEEDNKLEITKVGKSKLTKVYRTTIKPMKKNRTLKVREMYLCDNQLIIISDTWKERNDTAKYSVACYDVGYSYTGENEKTRIDVYDISNPKNVKRISSKSQQGTYETSRISDGMLYVFSNFYSGISYKDQEKKEEIVAGEECIPKVDEKRISSQDIYILGDNRASSNFYVISSWNLQNPEQCVDKKAILGWVNQNYVSQNGLYLMKGDWTEEDSNNTKIMKFAYMKGKVKFVASAKLQGMVNNSFAANESDGYLRVVTQVEKYDTDYSIYTNLYVLNANMKVVGELNRLAEDENLYAVRYVKDIAYFVTFEQVDPLFSVDLSQPSNPKILGKLKIPGFSEYLHLWSDHLLLGIGEEDGYVKLSMFDIYDPSDVKEVAKKKIKKGNYTDTDATYQYKSVCLSPEKNIIGFTLDISEESKDKEQYVVYSYDEKNGFVRKLSYSNYTIDWADNYEDTFVTYGNMRGLYIGKQFFVVVPGKEIVRYDMKNYEKIETYTFG